MTMMMMMMVVVVVVVVMMVMMMTTNPPGSSKDPKDGADKEVAPEGEGGVVTHSLLNVNISGTSC